MRHDIREGVQTYVKNNLKPNYAALARQYGVDYRTAKRAFQEAKAPMTLKKPTKRPSKLDAYRDIIEDKIELSCSAMAIFKFIQKKGFTGQYTIVRDYCAGLKKEKIHKATIRIEHTPGLSVVPCQ
ncbi:transposase [Levilactobacillus fujinensis]|uniref:transposase n=1 Tax=Levilactobacillus fujinensis TaxID=2486024 RepID=UPI00177D6E89|nr:transposase [Levilactobacillus fujinensis]